MSKKKLTGKLAADVAAALTAGLWAAIQIGAMRWIGDYQCNAFDIMVLLSVNLAVVYARRGTLWLTEG